MRRRTAAAAGAAALLNSFMYPNPGSGNASGDMTFVGPATNQSIVWRYGVDAAYDPDDDGTLYPILLFLHGQNSNEDAGMTAVWPQVKAANTAFAGNPATGMRTCIFVTVRAGANSWYTNNTASQSGFSTPGAFPIETMIVDELIAHILQHFRCNGVILLSGFSMGGFGAGELALRHRDVFRAVSLWQPPRVDSTAANWPGAFPTEYADIFSSSSARVDAHSWVQICDVQRAAIISEAYPMYCMLGSGDPGRVTWQNAINKVAGYGITLTSATATTTMHDLAQMADDGFAPLAIWYQQRIAP